MLSVKIRRPSKFFMIFSFIISGLDAFSLNKDILLHITKYTLLSRRKPLTFFYDYETIQHQEKGETMKVTVMSAMMGSGKTTRLIQEMKDMPPEARILYIAPLLSECHRIAGTHPEDDESQKPATSYCEEDGSVEYA